MTPLSCAGNASRSVIACCHPGVEGLSEADSGVEGLSEADSGVKGLSRPDWVVGALGSNNGCERRRRRRTLCQQEINEKHKYTSKAWR